MAARALPSPLREILVAFVALVALGVHGYSLPIWHHIIEAKAGDEVVLGAPREVRMDDYLVVLPMILAQRTHRPAFPIVNEHIGIGQNMLVPVSLPVAHVTTAFRPALWGYFLGADTGLAWNWWFLSLGVFLVWFYVFRHFAIPDVAAGIGAAALVCSPFLQFWSLVPAPAVFAAGMCFLATASFATSRGPASILASAAWLGWAGGCFVLTIYPPFQIPLAYLYLALVIAFVIERRADLALSSNLGARGLGILVALGIAGFGLLCFWLDGRDAIEAIRNSAYPGDRVATGGDRPLWALFSGNFAFAWAVTDFGTLYNICETASFWLMSPVVASSLVWTWLRRGVRPDPLSSVLLVFAVVLFIYCTVGFPEWLARGSLLQLAPGRRASVALGFADMLLLLRLLSSPASARVMPRVPAALVGAGFIGLLALLALGVSAAIPEAPVGYLLGMCALNGLFGYAICRGGRGHRVLLSLFAATALSTLWFNPVSRGGADYLAENPLSREIRRIDHEAGGDTVWLAFSAPYAANLLRVAGVRCLNGVIPTPQLELWRVLDRNGNAEHVYNRYAHVTFEAWSQEHVGFRLPHPDGFRVHIRPGDARLRELGVTHFLVGSGDADASVRDSPVELLAEVGRYQLYRLTENAGPAESP